MRLVHVTIPAGKLDAITSTLEEEDVDYVLTDETSSREYTAVATFPLPTEAVEPVLDALRAAGLSEEAFTIVVEAETVVSRRFEQLQERYEESDENGKRIAREELRAAATSLVSSLQVYTVMTVLSAVIATAGLLLDSPATVVGSMVIAPLIGPAMAASVGTVVDEEDLVERGIKLQVYGIGLSVASAAAFALFVKFANFVPPGLDPQTIGQVRERLSPDFLSLVVALGAGAAGATSLTAGVSSALVGVMIAVALIPPAATVGIGIAYGLETVALASSVLVLVNVLSINLSALLVFWYSGYRPRGIWQREQARSETLKRAGVLVAAILVLSVFLGAVTYSSVTSSAAERQIHAEVEGVVGDGEYGDLVVLDVAVQQEGTVLFRHPDHVTVTVGQPSGTTVEGLAEVLNRRIDAALDADVTVEVRLVETQVAN